jgi:hypothetical protein
MVGMDDIEELAGVIEDILRLLGDLGSSHTRYKKAAGELHQRLIKYTADLNERMASATRERTLLEMLIMSLIEELARSNSVDPSAVAKRYLARAESSHFLLDRPSLAKAKIVADLLNSSGFPDNLPPARGLGPILVVDNDQDDS